MQSATIEGCGVYTTVEIGPTEELSHFEMRLVTPEGKPQVKTKESHPYSYDPFVLWRRSEFVKPTGSVYSDRLRQWDWEKNKELTQKHFGESGDYWDRRDPAKIEKYLREYMDDPSLVLMQVDEYCNVSNGYPCWHLRFTTDSGLKGEG